VLYSITANLICIDFYVYFPKTAQSTALEDTVHHMCRSFRSFSQKRIMFLAM